MQPLKRLFLQNISINQILIKNTTWLLTSNVLSKSFKFFLLPIVTRVLGPFQFGIFNYTFSLISLFFAFSDFGLTTLFLREYQQDKWDKQELLSSFVFLKTILWVFAGILSFIASFFIVDPMVKKIFWLIFVLVVFTQIKTFIFNVYQAINRSEIRAISATIESLLTTIIAAIVLIKTKSFVFFVLVYVFTSSIGLFIAVSFFPVCFPRFKFFSTRYTKEILRYALLFMGSTILSIALLTSDNLMIKWVVGAEAVGHYQVSLRLIALAFMFSGVINTVFFPLISKYKDDTEKLCKLIKNSTSLLFMITIPVFFGGQLLAMQLVPSLFGSAYIPAIPAFRVMLFTLIIQVILTQLNYLLLALYLEKKNLLYSSVSISLNILGNLILIPILGILGAAIATCFARIIDIVLSYRLSKRQLQRFFFELHEIILFILSSVLMVIVVWFIQNSFNIHVVWLVLIGITGYGCCLILLREKYVFKILKYGVQVLFLNNK